VKLIIQIPCLNEEKTLPETLKDLPKHIDGIDVIEDVNATPEYRSHLAKVYITQTVLAAMAR